MKVYVVTAGCRLWIFVKCTAQASTFIKGLWLVLPFFRHGRIQRVLCLRLTGTFSSFAFFFLVGFNYFSISFFFTTDVSPTNDRPVRREKMRHRICVVGFFLWTLLPEWEKHIKYACKRKKEKLRGAVIKVVAVREKCKSWQ